MPVPIIFPDIPIASSQFYLVSNQAVFTSDVSGIDTVCARNGKTDRWQGFYRTPQLSENQHAKLTGWLLSLKGRFGSFYAFDPDRREPIAQNQGFLGNGIVNGVGQAGHSLTTSGWSTSSKILKAGDLFQIENQLYEVTSDVITDNEGNATIAFEPEIRTLHTNNAQIITSKPVMVARLKNPHSHWQTDFSKTGAITIFFEEVL